MRLNNSNLFTGNDYFLVYLISVLIKNFVVYIQTKNCLREREKVCVCVCEMENTSVEHKIENKNENGKHSETEKSETENQCL